MSGDSEAPPTYYFSGITFNPDFYQSTSSDYLTQTTAKKYFLTYPTAQGTETITTLNTSTLTASGLISANGGINVPTGKTLTVVGTQTSTGLITANGGVSATTLSASSTATTTGLLAATGGIKTSTIDTASGGTMAIGASTTGGITIGFGNAPTTVAGSLTSSGQIIANGGLSVTSGQTLVSNSINGTATNSAQTIGGNIDTGSITIGGTLTTGSMTLGGAQTTGDINIGNTNATGDIYIGNGSNSTTGANKGTCSIQKLQVGNTTASSGNGLGTGTPFRCLILGTVASGLSTGPITITGAPTTGTNPLVFGQISVANAGFVYAIQINVTGLNTFTYTKTATSGASVTGATESFNYIAIWL